MLKERLGPWELKLKLLTIGSSSKKIKRFKEFYIRHLIDLEKVVSFKTLKRSRKIRITNLT